MEITYHKKFVKKSKNLTDQEKKKLTERLKIFGQDQFHPILNNHALSGKYEGYRSINVTGDIRAIYKKIRLGEVIFVTIGSHSELYR